MSTGGHELLFEGFLRKRRDKMKLKWVTYWFRLESMCLSFYTKKNEYSIHLKGQYDLCGVKSVREVDRNDNKHYVFEIGLKNGKKKLLAADSAYLRQCWMDCLWRAIHLSPYCSPDPAFAWWGGGEVKRAPRTTSSRHSTGQLIDNHSTFGQWDSMGTSKRHTLVMHHDNKLKFCGQEEGERSCLSSASGVYESTYCKPNYEEAVESNYDTPLCRTDTKGDVVTAEEDESAEAIYDVPISYRKVTSFWSESIYDVPKPRLWTMSAQSLDDICDEERSPQDTFLYDQVVGDRRRYSDS
ncbi:uncharacterized protein LOC125718074 isoform X2 [Brienomyrus brachyistius]|uniref:uncharacterized protein LOC125718074 isoform X2 n=1 Tax=Brienomyrus brachyistius TaxID=42636 RepID=UPI0020B3E3E6|nr:uncharacterized protein LOC125718074 isoform X2 [Brienomyrus brachyistius]